MTSKRERLEDLDIKICSEYIIDQTTHAVQSKRNTVAGLQALINGKYIVADEFVDALVYAASPNDLEEAENLCPLERDYDAAWPDALKYLPPPGKENSNYPPDTFAPGPNRFTIFEDYSFVFCDHKQYENLLPAISAGHGKALLCRTEPSKTKADDIAQFMRTASGKKGFGNFESPDETGGTVLVRWSTKPEYQKWAHETADEVAMKTNQRPVEQREFLDAILANDARLLRKALKTTPVSIQTSAKPQSASTEIKAFDDGFDEVIPWDDDDDDVVAEEDPGSPPAFEAPPTTRASDRASNKKNSDKRPRSPSPEEEDMVNGLLPGAEAMKKRRLNSDGRPKKDQTPPPAAARRKKKEKEIDIREAARQKREADEAAARREREGEDVAMKGDDVPGDGHGLAVVEVFELPERPVPRSGQNEWDERWNGRKNFKAFRRRGENVPRRMHTQTVIVPLVEVTNRSYGIGQQYWEESSKAKSRRKEKDRERTQSQGQSQIQVETQAQVDSPEIATRPQDQSQAKRPAVEGSGSAPKRQKRIQTRRRDEDSDEEEGGFRFGRRSRA